MEIGLTEMDVPQVVKLNQTLLAKKDLIWDQFVFLCVETEIEFHQNNVMIITIRMEMGVPAIVKLKMGMGVSPKLEDLISALKLQQFKLNMFLN